jgi:hypothetical protein
VRREFNLLARRAHLYLLTPTLKMVFSRRYTNNYKCGL